MRERWRLFVLWLALQSRRFAQWLDPRDEAGAYLETIDRLAQELSSVEGKHIDAVRQFGDALVELQAAHDAYVALEAKHAHCIPVARDRLYDHAVALTGVWETKNAPSGEFKRHQVMASLMDEFPQRSKRDLALAIEAALWQA